MDRLDTWLNAQRGWRRLALIGVAWYVPTACLCFCLSVFVPSWPPPTPRPFLGGIALLALPGSVGFGSIMAALHSRRARSPKRKKGVPPFFMWRQIALPWVLVAGLAIGRMDRRDLVVFQMTSAVIVVALAVENSRYARRCTTPSAVAEPPALADE
jgi:hypothetical protein